MSHLLGADLSHFQGALNFDQLKTDLGFLIIKASEGVGVTDAQFSRSQKEARRVGLPLGYYHFAHPELNTALSEAEYFCGIVHPQHGEILCLDYENMSYGSPVAWCLDFLNHVSALLGGYKPLLYLNQSLVKGHDWSPVISANYGLWLAQYTNDPGSPLPVVQWPVVAMRQYSDAIVIQGQKVDGDQFYGDLATFSKYGYQPVATPPVPDLSKELSDAQAQIQLLTEKYSDYEAIKNERDQLKSDYNGFLAYLQEELLAPDDSLSTLKSSLTTELQLVKTLEDELTTAQKNLDSANQQHASDVADITAKLTTLQTLFTQQQTENAMYLRQIEALQAQILALNAQGKNLNFFQKVILQLQTLLKGKV